MTGRTVDGARQATDPGEMNAYELLGLYRRRELSPVEATQAALDRIERFNPAVACRTRSGCSTGSRGTPCFYPFNLTQ